MLCIVAGTLLCPTGESQQDVHMPLDTYSLFSCPDIYMPLYPAANLILLTGLRRSVHVPLPYLIVSISHL